MKNYDLAGQIIGLAMKVHRTLGPGFLEAVYHQALYYECKAIRVFYEDIVVGDYRADLFVNDELIVEIKAVQNLGVAHEVQTVNYLTATRNEIGLLINFGAKSLEYKKKFRVPKTANDLSANSV
ncbi:MAG: GxxExxY protein [Verrucomicrobiota bacterium]|nr:GxxExxY protein [Verrucomicrobiota bacterium]